MILSKKNKVVFIPVSELRPNPMQSRASFDGDSLAALTDNPGKKILYNRRRTPLESCNRRRTERGPVHNKRLPDKRPLMHSLHGKRLS